MSSLSHSIERTDLRLAAAPSEVCRALRRRHPTCLMLDGHAGVDGGWTAGPMVAVRAEPCGLGAGDRAGARDVLARMDRVIRDRRAVGGTVDTGIALLVAYELFADDGVGLPGGLPRVVALAVDRSIRWGAGGTVHLTRRGGEPFRPAEIERALEADSAREPVPAAAVSGRPRTSLPRARYLRAVERIREHIARGDVYQANLCQRFEVPIQGDPLGAHAALAAMHPVPRSAYVETSELAMASISPEVFLDLEPGGRIETRPIKGTRPRGGTVAEDRAAAEELLRSPKDRAELLMIVDLERNDLSRVCRAGTVEVPELTALRSYRAVHHLVARVTGRLAAGVDLPRLIGAAFPGGSITGAPKRRAMQILEGLEPVRRGFFSGSLFWFGDDGRTESSILIRSWVFGRNRAWLGAGGGIVAESDPEAEWRESNHKARALTQALGFCPEEAE